ncbi:hypothetical protein ABT025_04950 [Streptomyces sp. NPDC002809]|uniref:hypothetical protein n=1 Tax=Streptomyces sp. NPDC002809 TaxID=3154433 RepID=UPI00332A09EA
MPAPAPPTPPEPASRPVTDVVRRRAFGCLPAPVTLLAHGDSAGGAATVSLGPGAVTAVCRLLLRRSARTAAGPATHADGRSASRPVSDSASGPAFRPTEGAHRSDRTSRVVRR